MVISWIPWKLSFRYILFHEKRLQTMLWYHNARVNSHQRWKQVWFRICFHLWCELTSTMNVTEWQVSWNSWYAVAANIRIWVFHEIRRNRITNSHVIQELITQYKFNSKIGRKKLMYSPQQTTSADSKNCIHNLKQTYTANYSQLIRQLKMFCCLVEF